jgi:short-subunit dehydrogenase
MELAGKRVLITGASKGIGAAMAVSFARAGARVALAARSTQLIEALARQLDGTAHTVDLSDEEQIAGFIDRVEADGGPIDVLVNNAAIETATLIDHTDEAEITAAITTNLIAPARLTRQVLPGMLARGRGQIVYVASLAGVFPVPSASIYSASKAGLTHFGGVVAADLKGTPVDVLVVEPGPVDTQMWTDFAAGEATPAAVKRFRLLQLIPMEQPGDVADDVVRAVQKNRRHLRYPKRLAAMYWLENAPRRVTELTLLGIRPKR